MEQTKPLIHFSMFAGMLHLHLQKSHKVHCGKTVKPSQVSALYSAVTCPECKIKLDEFIAFLDSQVKSYPDSDLTKQCRAEWRKSMGFSV